MTHGKALTVIISFIVNERFECSLIALIDLIMIMTFGQSSKYNDSFLIDLPAFPPTGMAVVKKTFSTFGAP